MKLNLRLTFRGGFEVVILQDGIQAELEADVKGPRWRLRWNLRSVQVRRRGVKVELDADVTGGVEVEADVGSETRPGEGLQG